MSPVVCNLAILRDVVPRRKGCVYSYEKPVKCDKMKCSGTHLMTDELSRELKVSWIGRCTKHQS